MFDREPNIDIVFRNGLKDFEVLPPSDVWDAIPPVKVYRKKRITFYTAAAAIALLMTVSLAMAYLFRRQAGVTENIASLTPDKTVAPTASAGNNTVDARREGSGVIIVKDRFTVPAVKEPYNRMEPVSSENQAQLIEDKTITAEEEVAENTSGDTGRHTDLAALFNVPGFSTTTNSIVPVQSGEVKQKNSRFMVGGSLVPALSIVSGKGDNKTSSLLNNENSLPELTANLSVRYNVNPRFSIQTGVGVTTMGQIVRGIDVYAGLSDYYSIKGKYTYSVQTSSGVVIAENKDVRISDESGDRVKAVIAGVVDPSKLPLDYVNNDLRQRFRYLEVPVVARYKLIDRRIDMNVSGGFSYGYLIENVAFAKVDNRDVRVGYTEGVNRHVLSSQMGFGVEYNISRSFTFNIEPVVRYSLTPFSDASNAADRSYSFGIFSGLFFKF